MWFTAFGKTFQFMQPRVLYFGLPLLLVLAILWFLMQWKKYYPALKVSQIDSKNTKNTLWSALLLWPVLRFFALALLIIAIARPQESLSSEEVKTYGIDIVISVDISPSMLARDFSPNRLEVAKQIASDFVEQRPADQIGLVAFAGESFTQCPVTTDHRVVQSQIDALKEGILDDGTAIGMGIATAVNGLRESEAISKVVILLTDGENNSGTIDPALATELAMQFGIKIYTIGVGSEGTAPMPVRYPNGQEQFIRMPVKIDEDLLRDIAGKTNGKYFRATDKKALSAIFNEIDELEKTDIVATQIARKTELFYGFALAALFLLLLEGILRYTIFDVLS